MPDLDVTEAATAPAAVDGERGEDLHLETDRSSYPALYAHWERTQWSPLAIDFAPDRESFLSLDDEERRGMVWIFAHRFHAEFNVARLLAPFLLAAPSYDMQLLLATQTADEHRHLQAVLRVYRDVFGVEGGIEEVRALADLNLDPIAETLYGRLEHHVGRLGADASEDDFLAAVVVYHLLGEGVVARTAQNLAAGQYERHAFPGLARGQRLVARDEARHIGIGVSYARSRFERDPHQARSVVAPVIEEFAQVAEDLLATAGRHDIGSLVRTGYGVEPEDFHAEALRLTGIRLRSIGFLDP